VTPTRLLMIEVANIQEYIFGSNNLKQNIGASELVTQATRSWVFEELTKLELIHNGKKTDDWRDYIILNKDEVAHELEVEVIYAGGGNAVLLFEKDEERRKFVRRWTRRVFEEARGLQPLVKSTPIVWATEVLKNKIKQLHGEQASPTPAAPLLGLGVTAACVFTGLPATQVEDGQLIATVVKHKLAVWDEADERLHKVLPQVRKEKLEFIYNFDELGSGDEFSYLAVIHTDGNRMGERRKACFADFNAPEQNDRCVVALRNFSRKLEEAAAQALQKTVEQLLAIGERDPDDQNKLKFGLEKKFVAPKNKDKKECIPFRPIVFGGDDVTFVCDGRLGLSLAAAYLQEFSKQGLVDGKLASARAGVAIVKSHFPFSRSYEMADQLCASAKERREDLRKLYGVDDVVTMDWHFSTTGMVSTRREIRQREYTVPQGVLYMRPIALPKSGEEAGTLAQEWRTWQVFKELVDYFKNDLEWRNRRNKVKALREALRAGPETVELFLGNYAERAKLYEDDQNKQMPFLASMTGWDGNICVYYDAIEAMDFFISLERKEKL